MSPSSSIQLYVRIQCKITKATLSLGCKLREKYIKCVLNLQVLLISVGDLSKKASVFEMPGESKITAVFKVFDLIILLEKMTCFEPRDGMCVYAHVCAYATSSVGYRDIKHI